MKFWDSSGLVPLLVRQPTSERLEALLRRDPAVVVWWGAAVECASALAQLQREGTLARSGLRQAHQVLDHLRARAFEVAPVEDVRARAMRLLSVHQLRAADSLQLAAALLWCRERPQRVGFVCLDDGLRLAAAGEGFQVMPYAEDVHEATLAD